MGRSAYQTVATPFNRDLALGGEGVPGTPAWAVADPEGATDVAGWPSKGRRKDPGVRQIVSRCLREGPGRKPLEGLTTEWAHEGKSLIYCTSSLRASLAPILRLSEVRVVGRTRPGGMRVSGGVRQLEGGW
jgi:hypothetical protein